MRVTTCSRRTQPVRSNTGSDYLRWSDGRIRPSEDGAWQHVTTTSSGCLRLLARRKRISTSPTTSKCTSSNTEVISCTPHEGRSRRKRKCRNGLPRAATGSKQVSERAAKNGLSLLYRQGNYWVTGATGLLRRHVTCHNIVSISSLCNCRHFGLEKRQQGISTACAPRKRDDRRGSWMRTLPIDSITVHQNS